MKRSMLLHALTAVLFLSALLVVLHVTGSDAPRAAEEVPATDSPVDLPAGGLLQLSVRPNVFPGQATDGADVAGEHSTPSATPTPPSASEETEVRERLDTSQARSVESRLALSDVQVYELVLYVSGRAALAEEAVPVARCESTNGARRVKHEANGTVSLGLFMINSVHGWRFDLERLIWDDTYNTRAMVMLHDEAGGWGPWEACRP